MSWVDIVIIALLALFAVIGVLKGVKKSLLSLGAFIVAFLISFFLAKVVAEAFLGVDAIRDFVIGSDGWSLYTWIKGGLGGDYVPSEFLIANFYAPIEAIVETYMSSGVSVSPLDAEAICIAFTLFTAICGVGLFIVIRLLLCIVTAIIKSYIGRHKSALNRLFGFLVGAVRGFAWSFALVLVVSMFGGLTFLPGLNKVEDEFENSVIGKHVYSWSYAVKNKLLLPDSDMLARVVERSGLTVDSDDDGEDQNQSLLGTRLEIYCDLLNLNYDSQPYTYVNGELGEPDDPSQGKLNAAKYADSGFDAAVTAIMQYNEAAAQMIKDGQLDAVDSETLMSYKLTIQSGTNSIYDQWNAVLNLLDNYELHYSDSSYDVLQLADDYDNIKDKFDALKEKYGEISSTFGQLEFTLPARPSTAN